MRAPAIEPVLSSTSTTSSSSFASYASASAKTFLLAPNSHGKFSLTSAVATPVVLMAVAVFTTVSFATAFIKSPLPAMLAAKKAWKVFSRSTLASFRCDAARIALSSALHNVAREDMRFVTSTAKATAAAMAGMQRRA
ncbi:MAG: hypothetical protein AB7I52_05660 [Rhizobiaceae bacterium]